MGKIDRGGSMTRPFADETYRKKQYRRDRPPGRSAGNGITAAGMPEGTCLHFLPRGEKIMVSMPSSRHRARVRRTLAFIVRVPPNKSKKQIPEWVSAFRYIGGNKDVLSSTPIAGASENTWTLPRSKKVSTGHFFALPLVGPTFRVPANISKKQIPEWVSAFLVQPS